MNVTKICAGCYEAHANGRRVQIAKFEKRDGATFTGWIARAAWDNYFMTDPLPRYRDARREAERMLVE